MFQTVRDKRSRKPKKRIDLYEKREVLNKGLSTPLELKNIVVEINDFNEWVQHQVRPSRK